MKKKPVHELAAPEYPSADEAGVDRRRFLLLFAGGAATAVLAGCRAGDGPKGDGSRATPPVRTAGVPRPREEKPYNTPGPLKKLALPEGRVITRPETRLQGREISLRGGDVIEVVLIFSFTASSDQRTLIARKEEIMNAASAHLSTLVRASDLNLQEDRASARDAVRNLLRELLADEEGVRFLDFVVLSTVTAPAQVKGRHPNPSALKDPEPKPKLRGVPARPDPLDLD